MLDNDGRRPGRPATTLLELAAQACHLWERQELSFEAEGARALLVQTAAETAARKFGSLDKHKRRYQAALSRVQQEQDLGDAPHLLAWFYDEFWLPRRVVMAEAAMEDLEQQLSSFFADFEQMLAALGDARRVLPHPDRADRADVADLLTLCETTLSRLFDARLVVQQGQRRARPRESATAAHLAHDAAVVLARYAPRDGLALRKALLEALQWRDLYRRQRVVLLGPSGLPVFGQRVRDRPPDFFYGPRTVSRRSALIAADLASATSISR